jgi:hypothetical protein
MPFVSRARLSGYRCTVRCPRDTLAKVLRIDEPLALGAEPELTVDHPVCLELWRVDHGHLELAGLDQTEWLDLCVAGANALLSPRSDNAARRPPGWLGAARRGALRALQAWRSSLLLDGYSEMVMYVPDIVLRREPAPHSVVLRMCTDSPTALWIDRSFGYGYDKRLASFETAEDGALRVFDERGRELLCLSAHVLGELPHPELGTAEVGLAQAWLGRPSSTAFVESRLERSFYTGRVMALSGTLTLYDAPLAGRHELRAFSASDPWPSLAFADLPVRISLPQRSARLK